MIGARNSHTQNMNVDFFDWGYIQCNRKYVVKVHSVKLKYISLECTFSIIHISTLYEYNFYLSVFGRAGMSDIYIYTFLL